jgi:hypothetical protein
MGRRHSSLTFAWMTGFVPDLPGRYLIQLLVKDSSGVTALDNITVQASEKPGCLIATATFGSELAPQVQMLRETRDNVLLQTQSGATFMTSFNVIYYSFAPTIAEWEKKILHSKKLWR